MRKLALVIISLFCFIPMAFANVSSVDVSSSDVANSDIAAMLSNKKTVGVFLESSAQYMNSEAAKKLVTDKIPGLFPESKFKLLPFEDTQMAMRNYKEDHKMVFSTPAGNISNPLAKEDIEALGKELKLDYALVINVVNGQFTASAALFVLTYKATVTCDVRLLSVSEDKYLVNKEVVKQGKTSSVPILGVPSFDETYNEALKEALKDLTIDTSKL